jgi:large subunit ribosomal protein L15
MKYSDLNVAKKKSGKRVGRGIAAGQGKTAGRGTKGQNSRTGSSRKPGFEGGSNPMMQRLPKLRGFNSHKPAVEVVYTGQLDAVSGKTVDNAALAEAKLVSNPFSTVKLLLKGDITKAKDVRLQAASAQAVAALEKASGSFQITNRASRTETSTNNAGSRRAKKEAVAAK